MYDGSWRSNHGIRAVLKRSKNFPFVVRPPPSDLWVLKRSKTLKKVKNFLFRPPSAPTSSPTWSRARAWRTGPWKKLPLTLLLSNLWPLTWGQSYTDFYTLGQIYKNVLILSIDYSRLRLEGGGRRLEVGEGQSQGNYSPGSGWRVEGGGQTKREVFTSLWWCPSINPCTGLTPTCVTNYVYNRNLTFK